MPRRALARTSASSGRNSSVAVPSPKSRYSTSVLWIKVPTATMITTKVSIDIIRSSFSTPMVSQFSREKLPKQFPQ